MDLPLGCTKGMDHRALQNKILLGNHNTIVVAVLQNETDQILDMGQAQDPNKSRLDKPRKTMMVLGHTRVMMVGHDETDQILGMGHALDPNKSRLGNTHNAMMVLGHMVGHHTDVVVMLVEVRMDLVRPFDLPSASVSALL